VYAVNLQTNIETDLVARSEPGKPWIVEPQRSIGEVLQFMRERATGSILVCQDEKLVGVFTERDALKIMAEGTDLSSPIESVMIRPAVTVLADDSMSQAVTEMSRGGYRRLPVVDPEGRPLSVIRVSGIMQYLVEHFPQTIYNLPPQPEAATQDREGA
jgi:signal-transduction protein with cAMP-binding, CBS, and nucleotidyltransferase domain